MYSAGFPEEATVVIIVGVNVSCMQSNEDAEQHVPIRRWLEDVLSGDESVGLPWIVLPGFLRIATNPRVYPSPLSADEALATRSGPWRYA